MSLAKVPPHVKVIDETFACTYTDLIPKQFLRFFLQITRGHDKNANPFSQRSTLAEVRTNPTESLSSESRLSKNKVFPQDPVEPHLLSLSSSIPTNDEAWSPKHPQ